MKKYKTKDNVSNVYTVLCKYANDVVPSHLECRMQDIKLRYAIIVSAIQDLHCGSLEDQRTAMEYFKSSEYEKHCADAFIDKDLMDNIVYKADKYKFELDYEDGISELDNEMYI